MKINYYLIFLFFVILTGASCTGSKSYSKKALKLQEAGLNDEAAKFYLYALQRNPKNVEAKIGLKQTGQKQIESTLNDFYKAYSVSNYKDAVYIYQEALSYKKQYGYFVTMEVPSYYDAFYQEMLVVYLADRYAVAEDLLYEEKFKEANAIYQEIVTLDPEYKDAKSLGLITTIEPLYREGVQEFERKQYRSCYRIMANVLNKKAMYKDAIDYKERALELGRITIAVLEFGVNVKGREGLASTIQSDVVSGVSRNNDPFIRVIDRGNMDVLIKEQKINVHGANTGNSAIKTGELLGANVLVTGKLLSYSRSGGKVNRYQRQGFEAYKVKRTNPETKKTYYETMYRRVVYYEYEGSSSVTVEVQYQMVSAETGEIIKSDVVRHQSRDYVNYVSYDGNRKKLYGGSYSGKGTAYVKGDVIHTSRSKYKAIQKKMKSTKHYLVSESELAARCANNVSYEIVLGVMMYNPDER